MIPTSQPFWPNTQLLSVPSQPREENPFSQTTSKPSTHKLMRATKEFKGMDYLQEMAASTKKKLKMAYANLQYLLRTLPEGEVKKEVIKLVTPTPEK